MYHTGIGVRRLAFAGLVGLATASLPGTAGAAGNANAKIMLHALAVTTKSQCVRQANIPNSCSGFDAGVGNLGLYPILHFAYLIVVNGSRNEGVAGMQCGINYAGGVGPSGGQTPINVYGWTLCGTLEFSSPSPAWPSPGSGNLVTWSTTGPQCTAPPGNATIGAVGVAGYFYLAAYAPATFRVTERPVDHVAKVANCASVEDIVPVNRPDYCTYLGVLGFGRTGVNPCGRLEDDCGQVPVEAATWTKVKTLVSE